MRILYAIQGTGNGHMARAYEVIPLLKKYGKVDIVVSGIQTDIDLPWEVKYRFYGLSFIFGKNGGVDVKSTVMKFKPLRLIREMLSLPVHQYDLIFNDFEPVTAWACKIKSKKSIGLSHQSAVLHSKAPLPKENDRIGKAILKYYAPVKEMFGFHFKELDNNVTTPVIRADIRMAKRSNQGHYTVYLPSYSDEKIVEILSQISQIKWDVFSKHNKQATKVNNVSIQPVNKEKFTESVLSSTGILCNAGFETPAEALHLGKKLCVIPMKGQYEQQCNAAFLEDMGVRVIHNFDSELDHLNEWVFFDTAMNIQYPNNLSDVIDELMQKHAPYMDSLPGFAISNQFRMV